MEIFYGDITYKFTNTKVGFSIYIFHSRMRNYCFIMYANHRLHLSPYLFIIFTLYLCLSCIITLEQVLGKTVMRSVARHIIISITQICLENCGRARINIRMIWSKHLDNSVWRIFVKHIHKNIGRHTAHTIVSWPNPKQWIIVHTSDLIMMIRQIV